MIRSRAEKKVKLTAPVAFNQTLDRAADELAHFDRETLSPAAQWLTDNARSLRQKAHALNDSLRALPPLPALKDKPRLLFVLEGAADPSRVIRADDILSAAKKADPPLCEDELLALRPALTVIYLTRVRQACAECAQEARADREAARVLKRVRRGDFSRLPDEKGTAAALKKLLAMEDDRKTLALLDAHLNRRELAQETQDPDATLRVLRSSVLSLRALERIRFELLSEKLSLVCAILSGDETFPLMDRKSRDLYRSRVSRIARLNGLTEEAVARAAVALAAGGAGVLAQAGHYLLDAPGAILRMLGKKRGGDKSARARERAFCLPLYALFLLWLAAGVLLRLPWYVCVALALCVSELIRIPLFFFLRRAYPSRPLPRLLLPRIPKDRRALVVVPTLLTNKAQALSMVRHLSVLRSLSPESNLDFMLLSDLKDSDARETPEDIDLTHAAEDAVRALNEVYGDVFSLLVRERIFSGTERRYIGRERKRGALETLLALICGEFPKDTFCVGTIDPLSLSGKYAYVITLDADTLLLPGDARRLIGTMEHPLQKGRVAVVQPVMRVSPASIRTRAQRLLGGGSGVPAYAQDAQDVYQDMFGRGSFVGKGIIDPSLFLSRLKGRVREEKVLSHDLLEGEIAGSALAEDIFLLDGHPARLDGWYKRLHRWTRGDWQLFPFLADGRLSLLSRHKMLDNLRRSLVPAARVTLFLYAGFSGALLPALAALPFPLRGLPLRLWFLPAKAYACLDAAIRALYRMTVSRRHLLTWVTAQEAESHQSHPFFPALFQTLSGGALLFSALMPGAAVPVLGLVGLYWVVLPLLVSFFDGEKRRARPFTPQQREDVLSLSRDTFSFFEETVSQKTHFLPPDNIQLSPDKGLAMRTSPTNIGLYLLSLTAAKTLGFLTPEEFARRVEATVGTLEKLEKFEGHFYNWYDLETLSPLDPPFISSVDEGNLAACLLTCAQALRKELSGLNVSLRALPRRLDSLFFAMRFDRLFDREDGLFAIGLNVSDGKLTEGRYDLLASEALLLSFVAVMSGQAPTSHFKRLGRPLTRAAGGPALLSWGGTMFEYLMPCLLLTEAPGTLLYQTARRVVRAQRGFYPLRPFGVSESGYFAFDERLNYQYRAFGLPELALAPGTEGDVVAPYASMLALAVAPRAAAANLVVLKRLGAYGALGLYEALDYGKSRSLNPPALVKSHMAHHQGMILCAACNALTGGALTRLFRSIPAAEAYEYLLMEEAPGRARRLPPPPVRQGVPAAQAAPRAPGKDARETLLLSAERMTWATDQRGQGFLKSGELYLTWYVPAPDAMTGPQIYVREEGGRFFSVSQEARAEFLEGGALYRAGTGTLKAAETRFVSPMEGAVISWLTLTNSADEETRIELVSYLEPALSTFQDDAAHPNFRDLFITVERVSARALAAKRQPRDAREKPPLLLHYFLGASDDIRLQGDRALFLGRTGDPTRPDQLALPAEHAQTRLGDTVIPCLSIRAVMTVPPRGEVKAAFVTCACENEETADRALRFFAGGGDLKGALALAGTQAELTRRALRADDTLPALSSRLLGILLTDGAAPVRSAGREALWAHGISGDRPVLLALVPPNQDIKRVEKLLGLHTFWALKGVIVDLIFLCAQSEGYDSASEGSVRALASLSAAPRDALFILKRTPESQRALSSCARLTIDLASPIASSLPDAPLPQRACPIAEPLPPALPDYDPLNEFGGFSGERGFLVAKPAPQPWCNFLCNERFGTLSCETGILYTCVDNSRMRRLTKRFTNVLNPEPAEELTLTDASGLRFPLVCGNALHEPGVTTYFSRYPAFTAELTVFTDCELPCGARVLTVKNTSHEPLRLRLSWRVRFFMGETPQFTCVRDADASVEAVHPDFDGIACAFSPGAEAAGGTLSVKAEAEPGHQASAAVFLCFAKDESERRAFARAMLENGVGARLRLVRKTWDERLSRLTVRLPDDRVERLMNTFLPYQTRASRLFMRAGLYQTGGAFGFRDQLQDMMTFLLTDPSIVRAHLLTCAAHQFEEGDVQHWWHEPRAGVRTRITDDLLFLPYIAALYVSISGDESVLDETAPYLTAAPLEENEDDRYDSPALTEKAEPLRQHCLKAIFAVRFGAHGLPLMGGGDWNDGMNKVGGGDWNDGMNKVGGAAGESVWLAFFLCVTLERFAPYSGESEKLDALRRRVLASAKAAWTGKWYLRAWYSDGRTLGAPDSDVPRIDLISQCFAVFAGMPRADTEKAVGEALGRLWDKEHGILKLLDPPFGPAEGAGYIGGYLPGVRENGGQYTHAVPWMILALLRLNRIEEAWALFFDALPTSHADTDEKARVYRVEPYVLSADVYAGENPGRGGWTWYTGSAAWLYFAFFAGLMGVSKRGDKLHFSPCLPASLEDCTVIYRYGASTYELIADKETWRVTLDGERLSEGFVHLVDDGRTHTLRCGARTQGF